MKSDEAWDWEIKPEESWWQLRLNELTHYKDLLVRFVQRDFSVSYKQTVIGPFWIFLQPLLTALVYVFVFGQIAKVSTDRAPFLLFFLAGNIIWTYFSDCFLTVMYTFIHNAHVFSKVYFPRLIVPLSNVLSQSVRLMIQLLLFILIYLVYFFFFENVYPNWYIVLLPFLLVLTAAFALGLGLIASVLVAKYRDLDNLTQILLRLFMFATPVIYPLSIVPDKYEIFFWVNPLTWVIEIFRAAFLTGKAVQFGYMYISIGFTAIILLTGILLFKKRELKVMDTI
jgi:lipopolysaccharide transport system permease protein